MIKMDVKPFNLNVLCFPASEVFFFFKKNEKDEESFYQRLRSFQHPATLEETNGNGCLRVLWRPFKKGAKLLHKHRRVSAASFHPA